MKKKRDPTKKYVQLELFQTSLIDEIEKGLLIEKKLLDEKSIQQRKNVQTQNKRV